jgi:hypothetical protein
MKSKSITEIQRQAALTMIGQLIRNGKIVQYVNLRDTAGRLNGSTVEGSVERLISFCVLNRYV